jgi:hypothetical protein
MANIFDVSGSPEAAAVNLTRLAASLQATPESVYTWANFTSKKKYGVMQNNAGTKQQIDRLRPIESPDPDNLSAYDVAQVRNAISTADANLQKLSYDTIEIELKERAMPKPLAIKEFSLRTAQVNLLAHAAISLRRNRSEYQNFMSRAAIRGGVSTTIFAGVVSGDETDMTNDVTCNLSVAEVKRLKRSLVLSKVRGFGGFPNSDGQILNGFYPGILDIDGVNQLTADPLWREFRREETDHSSFNQGYIGNVAGLSFFQTDDPEYTEAGGSLDSFNGSELIVMGQDPTLLEVPEGESQGFVGEFPICYAQLGTTEVRKAGEDNFGKDWLTTWFATELWAQLQELTSGDAAALTSTTGNTFVAGKSQFIQKIVYSPSSQAAS